MAKQKIDWKYVICFIAGSIGFFVSTIICVPINFTFLIFLDVIIWVYFFSALLGILHEWPKNYFLCLKFPRVGKVKPKNNLSIVVPQLPRKVLDNISGLGPFAILFEVTEGWKKFKSDSVILRVINIKGNQFFEPILRYNITPLEKSSLTKA